MDEFSPGKYLLSEKSSNVVKKSAKKVQLRADVKLRIKQRLLRDKAKENRDKAKENHADNNTGIVSPFDNYLEPNLSLPNHNSTMNKGSKIAKVAEKLWRMKRNPYLRNEKFVFAGRVPCFLKRNIKKVDRNKRGRCVRSTRRRKVNESLSLWRRKKPARNQNATKEFYFRYKHENTKRPASGRIDNDRAKRLCLEPGSNKAMADGRIAKGLDKTPDSESVNARRHLDSGRTGLEPEDNEGAAGGMISKGLVKTPCFESVNANTEEVSSQSEERFADTLNNQNDPSEFQGTMAGTINTQKRSFPKNRVPKNGSHGERSRPKAKSSFKRCGGKMNQENFNSDFNESQSIPKEASGQEEQSGIFKRNLVGKSSNENAGQGIINKEKGLKALMISLMDCFANGLHARQNLTQGSFHATSTPRAIRVPANSQDVPTSRIASRAPTSHINPRVPTSDISHITPKVPTFDRSPRLRTSHVNPRIPTSDITPRVLKSQMTPTVPSSHMTPPESEVSCTENEGSIFTREVEFERDKLRGGLNGKNKSKRTSEGMIYKPLFSNKPRLWKSVVVENDN